MPNYRIDFSSLEWESPLEGVRHKVFTSGVTRLRLVEYLPTMPLHWCEKGHMGYILEGNLQVEFDAATDVFTQGDGVFIPDGAAHKHRAKVLSDVVRAIFVEDA
jgi:quercetin dioxygenase-like cupin family protein